MRRSILRTGRILAAILTLNPWVRAEPPTPKLSTLHSFAGGDDGKGPLAGVTIGADGVLYGSTVDDGVSGYGTAFLLTAPAAPGGSWTESVYSFPQGKEAGYATGTFAVAKGGKAVGTTLQTGSGGAVFTLRPPVSEGGFWTQHVIHAFAGYPSDGMFPNPAVEGQGGVFYGTTQYGGNGSCRYTYGGCGTVFSLTPPAFPGTAWTETVLYNFGSGSTDGSYPLAGLTIGAGGVLYGTTYLGGSNNTGIVFSLTPAASEGGGWTESVLYSFPAAVYGYGAGQLVIGSDGTLYGTSFPGPGLYGGVFAVSPPTAPGGDWSGTEIYNFGGVSDASAPGSLVISNGGVLYGVARSGGTYNSGLVFSLMPPTSAAGGWAFAPLYIFTGGSDGGVPEGIAMGSGGTLYGTTNAGGSNGDGTVFALSR